MQYDGFQRRTSSNISYSYRQLEAKGHVVSRVFRKLLEHHSFSSLYKAIQFYCSATECESNHGELKKKSPEKRLLIRLNIVSSPDHRFHVINCHKHLT